MWNWDQKKWKKKGKRYPFHHLIIAIHGQFECMCSWPTLSFSSETLSFCLQRCRLCNWQLSFSSAAQDHWSSSSLMLTQKCFCFSSTYSSFLAVDRLAVLGWHNLHWNIANPACLSALLPCHHKSYQFCMIWIYNSPFESKKRKRFKNEWENRGEKWRFEIT